MKAMKTLFLLVFVVSFLLGSCTCHESTHGKENENENMSVMHKRTRVKQMLRKLQHDDILQVMGDIWNKASGESRIKMVKKLFNGFPPARLTRIQGLMKLSYDSVTATATVKRSQQATELLEEYSRASYSEEEKLNDLEANAWPKLNSQHRKNILSFFQLSKDELTAMSSRHSVKYDSAWNENSIQISSTWYLLCTSTTSCPEEAPVCSPLDLSTTTSVCHLPCRGDEECYAYSDAQHQRSHSGKCMRPVCEGFTQLDAQNTVSAGSGLAVSMFTIVFVFLISIF